MAYEIGSGSKALTLPNPFKTHNLFLLASAIAVGAAAILLLFDVRQELAVRHVVGVPLTLAVAVGLLIVAVGSIYTVLSRLTVNEGGKIDRGGPDQPQNVPTDHSHADARLQLVLDAGRSSNVPTLLDPTYSCMTSGRHLLAFVVISLRKSLSREAGIFL